VTVGTVEIAAEDAARAKHELRAALGAVRLGVELSARLGELASARASAIGLELDRAARALDDLDGRRLGAAEDPVDIRALLADSVEAWRAVAAARGVDLRLRWNGQTGFVAGDRIRLAQATGNLIANALEHGEGPAEVCGHVTAGVVRVEVIDSGAGLPAPVAELTRRARGGRGRRGRGLAIAAAVARAHRGRLAAAPTKRGARLVLELPTARVTPK